MTDNLRAAGPLDALLPPVGGPADAGLVLAVESGLGLLNLRVDPAAVWPLDGAPPAANRFVAGDDVTAAWLGPDEFLVITALDQLAATADRLAGALAGHHAGVTEVSDHLTVIRLSGPRARWVLAKGCALDLHPRVFGPGDCAQTLFERAGITLLQRDAAPTYHLLVRRSFAAYLWAWLVDAGQEVGVRFEGLS
ncbi:MAG: sarcosine oxidase subunit gamma family protein [Pseudomonadota bacterium]|nr:sarcosine oxidase subunit gamma family protein [Pseudomonadota bacterium]